MSQYSLMTPVLTKVFLLEKAQQLECTGRGSYMNILGVCVPSNANKRGNIFLPEERPTKKRKRKRWWIESYERTYLAPSLRIR